MKPGRVKSIECKPCPNNYQTTDVIKHLYGLNDTTTSIPEGGTIPDVKVPSFSFDPKTGKRIVTFRRKQYDEVFHAPECVYLETKYYWVKNIKDGKMYMASERIERQDGKFISCWSVKDGPDCTSNTGFSKEGILEHYEIVEEICPPTTQW
jgi:hypothetical protein